MYCFVTRAGFASNASKAHMHLIPRCLTIKIKYTIHRLKPKMVHQNSTVISDFEKHYLDLKIYVNLNAFKF